MNYSEKHLDKIDDELSRPERNGDPPKFSQSISSDPELKAAAEDVELIWQATRLERLQGKLEMLKGYEEEAKAEAKAEEDKKAEAKAEAKEDKKIKVVSVRRMRWVLSAAAGVLLLVSVGLFLFRDQGPQEIKHEYLAMHFEDYVMHDVMKGDEVTKHTSEQIAAYDLFAIKDFKNAIPLLKQQWEEKSDSLALFYLWVSYVAVGDEKRSNLYREDVLKIDSAEIRSLAKSLL